MTSPGEVLATIPVGMEPRWIAIAPDGSRAYVTLQEFHADVTLGGVGVIDTRSNTLVTTINVGDPSGVVIAPDGRRAYVPNWDSGHARGVVSVIDTAAGSVIDTIAVSGPGGGPKGVAITRDGRHVYVATDQELGTPEEQGKVSVIDTDTKTVIARIAVDPFPAAAATTPDGRFVWVLDTEGSPAVIDTASQERTFPFGSTAMRHRVAFTPDGRLAYGIDDANTEILAMDVATNQLHQLLEASGLTTDVAVTPDGRFVYITQRTAHQISVLETGAVMRPTHPVSWSGSADGIAMMQDGRTAYVSDRRSRAVHVIPVGPHSA
jgi:YVTN family beta-propeller protein